MSRQGSAASLSAMDTTSSWYSGTQPTTSHVTPVPPVTPAAPLASLGHGSSSGANIIAAAATQAIAATQQVTRGSLVIQTYLKV